MDREGRGPSLLSLSRAHARDLPFIIEREFSFAEAKRFRFVLPKINVIERVNSFRSRPGSYCMVVRKGASEASGAQCAAREQFL